MIRNCICFVHQVSSIKIKFKVIKNVFQDFYKMMVFLCVKLLKYGISSLINVENLLYNLLALLHKAYYYRNYKLYFRLF